LNCSLVLFMACDSRPSQ